MVDPLNILHTVGFQTLYPIVRCELVYNHAIELERLKRAVAYVANDIPELMSCYEIKTNTYHPIDWPATSVVHEVDRINDDLVADWDLESQPQWQLYWVKKTNSLVVYGSHIFTDGAGFKQLLNVLAKTYNEDQDCQVKNHTDIEGIRQLLKETAGRKVQNDDHPNAPLELPEIVSDGKERHYRVIHAQLDLAESETLYRRSKEQGIHLNDVFMAAFGKAIQQYCGVGEISLACPTDMRKFLPEGEQKQLRVQNMTGRYNIHVPATLDEPLAETAWNVHRAMDQQKEERAFLESFRSMIGRLDNGASVAELQGEVEKNYHIRGISYTNLAIIDANQLQLGDSVVRDAWISGGFRTIPLYQIAVSTFRRHVNLVVNVIGTPTEIQFAKAVMNRMKLFLLSL